MCGAHAILLYMCHSWSGHVTESWCVGEWGSIVVRKFKASLPLPPITKKSVSLLNGVDFWFWVTVTSNCCLLSRNFLACFLRFSSVHFLCFFKVLIFFDHVFILVWFCHWHGWQWFWGLDWATHDGPEGHFLWWFLLGGYSLWYLQQGVLFFRKGEGFASYWWGHFFPSR